MAAPREAPFLLEVSLTPPPISSPPPSSPGSDGDGSELVMMMVVMMLRVVGVVVAKALRKTLSAESPLPSSSSPPPPSSSSPQPHQHSSAVILDIDAVDDGDETESAIDLQEFPSLAALPDEVLVHLFQMLPDRERGRLASTCRSMNRIMHSASVWTDASIQLKCVGSVIEGQERQMCANKTLVENYESCFQNVEVVLRSLQPSFWSLNKLRSFAQRGVLKRAKLVVEDKEDMSNILIEPYEDERLQCRQCDRVYNPAWDAMIDDEDELCTCVEPVLSNEEAEVRELVTTNTHLTLQVSDIHRDAKNILNCLYSTTDKSSVICKAVTTLILPELQHEHLLTSVRPRQSQTPTAVLVSDFPNLHVLHVSLRNVSEELLLELSNVSKKRAPLKKLVLMHKDFQIDANRRFPSVASSTWSQLTSACPGVAVECRVRVLGELFPLLTSTIKPETPLVRLEVTVDRKEVRDSQCVKGMMELCREHKCPFMFVP